MSNHYEKNILTIEKFNPSKIWTAIVYDADQKYPYIKRFALEATSRKQNFVGENPKNELLMLTDEAYPRFEVVFGGNDAFREPLIIDADEFSLIKGFKAKGKRLTTYSVETINELESIRKPEETEEQAKDDSENVLPDGDEQEGEITEESPSDIIDEITGQMKLF